MKLATNLFDASTTRKVSPSKPLQTTWRPLSRSGDLGTVRLENTAVSKIAASTLLRRKSFQKKHAEETCNSLFINIDAVWANPCVGDASDGGDRAERHDGLCSSYYSQRFEPERSTGAFDENPWTALWNPGERAGEQFRLAAHQ